MASKWDILAPEKNNNFNNGAYACFSPKNDAIVSGNFLPRNAPKLTYSD